MNRAFLVFAGVSVLLLSFASEASAYCRTTTCARDDAPEECFPGKVVDGCQMEGLPLFWPESCVSFSVQTDGSATQHISANTLEALVARSFDTWLSVDCGNGKAPGFEVQTYPQVTCDKITYNTNARNQNLWTFRDGDWPYTGDGDRTIALTMVTFNWKNGEIMDVDVELNSFARPFSVQTNQAGDDLLSVIQHESGHFLGLAHTNVEPATMFTFYRDGTAMRTLDADDAAGVCTIYPPAEIPKNCDAEPRHGFSLECAEPLPSSGCCAVAAGAGRRNSSTWLLVPLGLLAIIHRRHRSGAAEPSRGAFRSPNGDGPFRGR